MAEPPDVIERPRSPTSARCATSCVAASAGSLRRVDDLGLPISYLVLEKARALPPTARRSVATEIRADLEKDIFDGLVVDGSPLPSTIGSCLPTRCTRSTSAAWR